MKLSLRNQLSIWVGVATLVIVFLTIFITEQITVWNLETSLDENIQKRAYMVASLISSDITTDETSYALVINDLANQELSFVSSQLRVISPSGKPIVEFGKIAEPVVQQLDHYLQSANVNKGDFSTLYLSGIDPLRSYTISVPDPRTRSPLAYVQIIESLSQIEQAKRGLWRNGIIIGLVGGLIAVAIGQILIRRGFKPLQTIVEAIDKADYSHLKSGMADEYSSEELQQLAKSLSAMWLRLDMAVNEKRRAVGNMSHDLRTPLTALQGQMEVLLEQPSLAPEARDSVERMLNETRRLTRMVKNMLLNVQLETKPALYIEDVNLREIVDRVIGDLWKLTEGLRVNIIANEKIAGEGARLGLSIVKQIVDLHHGQIDIQSREGFGTSVMIRLPSVKIY
jgi:signal transduction histidine kinase